MKLPSKWGCGLILALVLGAVFRLIWVGDIEYKLDETFTFAKTRQFVADGRPPAGVHSVKNTALMEERMRFLGEAFGTDFNRNEPLMQGVAAGNFSWLGMPSSQRLRNPGMSLWGFYLFGFLFGTDEPTGIARGVQVFNLAAIFFLVIFALCCLKDREREWWLWAAALVCVNPIAVVFHRKIWPPCMLPLLMIVLILCWRFRGRRWGAFGWGALGALPGQISMAGFFYSAALALWTFLFDRKRVAWRWWLGGGLIGAIPLLPWLYYLAHTTEKARANVVSIWRPLEGKFWGHWMSEPFCVGLNYSLGHDFHDYLSGPLLAGHRTYGVGILHGLAAGLGIWLLGKSLFGWWRNRTEWQGWLEWWSGRSMFTTFLLSAVFWGFGLILSATCLRFYKHYLLLVFPLIMVWAARLALPMGATERQWAAGRRLLLALCVTNALITMAFLGYIHAHDGVPHGEYWMTYDAQIRGKAGPLASPTSLGAEPSAH